jgi:tRNA-2-methylthio-N6-dimethylallyladenosine synthase
LAGQFVDVLITEALTNSLRGRIVDTSVDKIIQHN